jgi:hypothetical protein
MHLSGVIRSALVLLVALVFGCAPSGPKTYPVSGTVTFDGQPLQDGYVTFVSSGGDIGPDAGKISAGEFSFRAQAGPKRVEIQANRPKPGAAADPAMGAVPQEQFIPSHYNLQSTLTAEVKPDGENRYEFQLKSKP